VSVYQCKLQASISLCQWMEAYAHKKQFVVINTACQNEIPALLDSWVKNTSSVKMLYPLKKSPYIFIKT